jgi:hypothetical protein
MKPSALASLVFLLGSTIVVAQGANDTAPGQARPASQTFSVSAATSSCPVSLRALQGTGGGLVAVHNAKPMSGPSQHIHLVLSDTKSAVLTAKVVVRGLSGKNQILQTSGNGRFDLTKTLDVRFVSEDDSQTAADLILPGFTSVQSVELESIRYQDGSTWTFAGREACRVAPDPFMLVGSR